MIRYLGTRALRVVLVFLLVSFATVSLTSFTPGDPAVAIAGESATPEVLTALRKEFGLNKPIVERWGSWMGDVVRGDFGKSYTSRQPVMESLRQRLPVTLELALLATLLTVLLAIPAALLAAYRQGSAFDRFVSALSAAVISVPGFVIALLLVSTLALTFSIFPVSGWVPLSANLGENLRSAALPALTLALGETAILLPVLRADVVTTLEQEYIALARAKGISSARILFRHALRPSSVSLVTLLALSLARLFGGAVIVETIFGLPGLGGLLISSIRQKDLLLTQGLVMFIATVYLLTNFVVDLAYTRLDPRVRIR